MGTGNHRRGASPGGGERNADVEGRHHSARTPDPENVLNVTDITAGRTLIGRVVERPDGFELLRPAGDELISVGTFRTRKAALAAAATDETTDARR